MPEGGLSCSMNDLTTGVPFWMRGGSAEVQMQQWLKEKNFTGSQGARDLSYRKLPERKVSAFGLNSSRELFSASSSLSGRQQSASRGKTVAG